MLLKRQTLKNRKLAAITITAMLISMLSISCEKEVVRYAEMSQYYAESLNLCASSADSVSIGTGIKE